MSKKFQLKEYYGIAGILLFGLMIRLPLMGRGLYYDELYVALHYVKDHAFLNIITNFWPTNHVGYTIVSYLTYHLLGGTEWAFRLPALLFGLAGIYLVWFYARKYFGIAVAYTAAVLLACSPADIIFSVSARGYSALIFFGFWLSFLYFELLNKPDAKKFWKYVAVFVVGSLFHLFLFAVLLCQGIHLVWVTFKPKQSPVAGLVSAWKALFLSGSIAGLINVILTFASWYSLIYKNFSDLNPYFPVYLTWDILSIPFLPYGILVLLAALIGLGLSGKTKELINWRFYGSILLLFPIVFWLCHPPYLYFRFFAYLIPLCYLWIAVFAVHMVTFKNIIARVSGVAVVVLLVLVMVATWIKRKDNALEEYVSPIREGIVYAQRSGTPYTRYCALGGESATLYNYYSSRPVKALDNIQDFQTFMSQGGPVICFVQVQFLDNDDLRKIFLVLMNKAQVKKVNGLYVFQLP